MRGRKPDNVTLPPPVLDGRVSLEKAISSRRSIRNFSAYSLSPDEISQLLWSLQGITDSEGLRATPSAGALYPLEIYLLQDDGFYHYEPKRHRLRQLSGLDLRKPLYENSAGNDSILVAPAVFVITAVYARMEWKYGKSRTSRYVDMEVGHAAQNLLLQAVTLGLGAVPLGAFEDTRVARALGLPSDHRPLYLIPVGRVGEE